MPDALTLVEPRPPRFRWRWVWLVFALLLVVWPVRIVVEQYRIRRIVEEMKTRNGSVDTEIAVWVSPAWQDWGARRGGVLEGLISKVAGTQYWARRQGGLLQSLAVSLIRLTEVQADGPEFDAAWLQRLPKGSLQSLRLTGTSIQGTQLRCLTGCLELKDLRIERMPLEAEHLAFLTQLPRLSYLLLQSCELGDGAVHVLADCRHLDRLTLTNNSITDVAPLAGLPVLKRLTFTGNPVTDAGLQGFAANTSLTTLELVRTEITDAGLAHLPHNLQTLNLSETAVTSAGLRHLAVCPWLGSLYLDQTGVSDTGLAHVPVHLWNLSLHHTAITDAGLQHLAKCTSLKCLYLNGTGVTDRGLLYIPRCVDSLSLTGTAITDAGILQLPRGIQGLTLASTMITDACIPDLLNLHKLDWLHISKTRMTAAGVKQLQEKIERVNDDF